MLRLKIVVTDEWCYHTINFQHNIHTYNGIIGNVLHLWNRIATLMGPYFACNYYYEVKGTQLHLAFTYNQSRICMLNWQPHMDKYI